MEEESELTWKERYLRLEAKFAQLEEENRLLKTKILELEEKLRTSSNNSSKTPSQDPFRAQRPSQPTGKKTGGQPGHPGHTRQMHPLEQVFNVVDLKPQNCPNCGPHYF